MRPRCRGRIGSRIAPASQAPDDTSSYKTSGSENRVPDPPPKLVAPVAAHRREPEDLHPRALHGLKGGLSLREGELVELRGDNDAIELLRRLDVARLRQELEELFVVLL